MDDVFTDTATTPSTRSGPRWPTTSPPVKRLAPASRSTSTANPSSICGAASPMPHGRRVDQGHHRQRVVVHEDGHQPGRPDARRPWSGRTGRAGRQPTGRNSRQMASRTSSFVISYRTPRVFPAGTSPFTTEDMYDWDKSTAALAAQAPWWEPGTASGYHAHNQGHLIGEVMRRVTGRSLKEFVRDEIAGPLGADFQIGARRDDYDRIAEIIPPPPLELPLEHASRRQPDAQNLQRTATQRRRREHTGLARGRHGRTERPRQRAFAGDDTCRQFRWAARLVECNCSSPRPSS